MASYATRREPHLSQDAGEQPSIDVGHAGGRGGGPTTASFRDPPRCETQSGAAGRWGCGGLGEPDTVTGSSRRASARTGRGAPRCRESTSRPARRRGRTARRALPCGRGSPCGRTGARGFRSVTGDSRPGTLQMSQGTGISCMWTRRSARTDGQATSPPMPASGVGVPPARGTRRIRPLPWNPLLVEKTSSFASGVHESPLQNPYFPCVSCRARGRPTGCTHTSWKPQAREAARTNASCRPSGDRAGERSPSESAGGEVRGVFSSVASERRTIRAGSSSPAFSARASHFPSGDQDATGRKLPSPLSRRSGPARSIRRRAGPPKDDTV
jgi:hypothetical protein